MIHYIESKQINDEVIKNSEKLVIINFYATWCMPCEEFSKVLTQVEKKYGEEVEFYKVDSEESNETSARFNIQSKPTTLIFRDGMEVERIIGMIKEEKLIEIIEELI